MKLFALLTLLISMLMPQGLVAATLHIQVVDEAGKPSWERIEVRRAGGQMYQCPDALRDHLSGTSGMQPFYSGSFIVQGDCQVEVPPGHYLVVGMHGTEYVRVEKAVTVRADGVTNVTMVLHRWVNMRRLGWWSADMHVHRPPADVEKAILAEDLNFAPIITGWGGSSDQFQMGDVYASEGKSQFAVDDQHRVSSRNWEDERGPGAWLFFQLLRPLEGLEKDKATRWWPTGLSVVEQVRGQHAPGSIFPWIDTEKPFWWEVPVVMALAPSDSMEILPNHITEYGLEAGEAWGRPFTQGYLNREGWMDDVLGLYYRYLNLGIHVAPTAGSASGVLPNPIGFNRVYANFSGPFTVQKFFEAVRDGHSFVTNGPMLFFEVKSEGKLMRATVEAHAGEPLDRVEIVADGEVIEWYPVRPAQNDFQADFTFDPNKYSWIAARCYLPGGDTLRLAHSSPYYLPGHHDCRDDAKYYVDWMNDLIQQAKTDPKRIGPADQQQQRIEIYSKALTFYQQKMDQGCGGH
jgi:hypothetical protein